MSPVPNSLPHAARLVSVFCASKGVIISFDTRTGGARLCRRIRARQLVRASCTKSFGIAKSRLNNCRNSCRSGYSCQTPLPPPMRRRAAAWAIIFQRAPGPSGRRDGDAARKSPPPSLTLPHTVFQPRTSSGFQSHTNEIFPTPPIQSLTPNSPAPTPGPPTPPRHNKVMRSLRTQSQRGPSQPLSIRIVRLPIDRAEHCALTPFLPTNLPLSPHRSMRKRSFRLS